MPLEEFDDDDEQAVMVSHHGGVTNQKESFVRRHWQWLSALVAACFVALVLFGRQDSRLVVEDITSKPGSSIGKKGGKDCTATCQEHVDLHTKKYGGSLMDSSLLLRRTMEEREAVKKQLKQDYGEDHFNKIFLTEDGETIGKTAFASAGDTEQDLSRKRLVRKMMLKLLQVQLMVKEELADLNGCNCGSTSFNTTQRRSLGLKDYYQKFVWANGGHSASAGHGNFHHESYTAVMERTAQRAFAAVGIEFEGRNYAMGGMDSAPELALCNEAVYGMDADIISWDFGMTDGRAYWKKYLYGNRAGIHRNRPAIVEFGVMGRVAGPRVAMLKELEEAGLAGMYLTNDLFSGGSVKEALPDMATMTVEQISETPKFVQHFRCGNAIEEGDPTCAANKFTKTTCTLAGRVKWHPGWKAHALNGNIMALFMIETLIDAIKALDAQSDTDRKTLFDRLKKEEDADYELFFKSNFTVDEGLLSKELAEQVDASLLFRNPAMCHTAILPAKTRYLGILTDTQDTSSYEHYELGLDQFVADKSDPSDTWRLTYDPSTRNSKCPTLEQIDFKDAFYIRHVDGESSLTIPNAAEQKVYLDNNKKLSGLVIMCFFKCAWGRCREGTMTWEQVNDGNVTMAVNGDGVEEMTQLGACFLLRGEQGYYWKPNENGQYTFTAQVHQPNSFMQISSIILL